MAAIFDFFCHAHGHFEGSIGRCPYGCGAGMVEKIWLKAPGVIGDKTKTTDALRDKLADQYGLTDMQTRAGRPAVPEKYRWNDPQVLGSSKPYSVPVDAAQDLFVQATGQGAMAEESSTLAAMQKARDVQFRAEVIADDRVRVTPEQIAASGD